RCGIVKNYAGSVRDAVVRYLVEIHQRELRQSFLKLSLFALEKRLALLGRFVLGVLPQIAVLARLQDLLRKLDSELVVDRVQLVLKLLSDIDHCGSSMKRQPV